MAKRGGSRKHPEGCTCGKCPKMGRPKVERLANPKVSEQILRDVRAYELEKACIAIEVKRLGIDFEDKKWLDKVPIAAKTEPLFKMLDRLKCHAHGNPQDNVNHLHDQPIDVKVTHSLSERMLIALEKAEARVRRK